jgi:HlyD family secretion protein
VKWVIWIVVLAGASVLGWFGWNYLQKSRQKPAEYRTAQVTRGDLTQAVTASGQLNPVISVQVGSQISGMIQQLNVDYNSSVTQNQVIAELDASTYRAAVHQADADLASAKAGLELAQLNARRASELRKTDLIAISENDKAVADLHQAEAQVYLRDAALERARVDLGRCTIYAPTNGIVISRNVDVGQTVAASLSAPTLFVLANNLSKMQIDALVSEADIGGVEIDQPVTFTVDAFPTRAFSGKVIQIRNAPSTNQNVVAYDTVVAVDNADLKLKPGMTANVSIILAQHEDVLKIPNAALRFKPVESTERKGILAALPTGAGREPGQGRPGGSGGGSGGWTPGGGGGPRSGGGPPGSNRANRPPTGTRTIYVLDSSKGGAEAPEPKPRQIKTGISDGTFTEVLDGMNESDVVILGSNSPTQPAMNAPPSNPFGGGGMRRF